MTLSWLATAAATLGVGKIPRAPGTFGSLLALLIWWAIPPMPIGQQFLLILVALGCGWVGVHYYEKWNHKHDPKEIVIDELVGMWLTLLGAPHVVSYFLLGFLFFRLFDIWKPFPVSWFDQKVSGAWGTLLDDVMAAVLAYGALHGTVFIIGRFFGLTFS